MDVPEKDTPDEERPEGVETVQEYKRSEDLPFHPPNHPNTLTWRPTTRRMSIPTGRIRKVERENVEGLRTESDRSLCTQTRA
jgi:hypothetical protein